MAGKVTDDHLLPPPCDVQESASESDADPLTDPPGVHRLHSSAMLAELLAVPPAAVRHWVRGGLLQPVRRSGSLEWFDFPQLVVGRHLARLLGGGLSLREIDAKLAHLTPGGAPAAAVVAERIVADGRRLSIRDGDRLLGAGGQMQFTFYTDRLAGDGRPPQMMPAILPGWPPEPDRGSLPVAVPARATDDTAEILDLADDLEAAGEFAEAAEALRAVLQAQGPTAPVMFMLAELLYRAGDLAAAQGAVLRHDRDRRRPPPGAVEPRLRPRGARRIRTGARGAGGRAPPGARLCRRPLARGRRAHRARP